MTEFTERDRELLERALVLAEGGRRRASPNPMVGCVVSDAHGDVVGEGFHERCGGPHAEVGALLVAGERARGGEAHVTLEPCAHTGRTPPCTQALLAAGIARVVVGVADPNPEARGGTEVLREGGVEVVLASADLQRRCATLNRAFFTRVREGRPLVVAKWAMTLDGRIATSTGESQWITGEAARADVHALRDRVDAILVGAGTALADDPQLTTRGIADGRNPVRVVLDGRLRVHPDLQLVATAVEVPTIVLTWEGAPEERARALADRGVEVVRVGGAAELDLSRALQALARRGIGLLMVEGGAQTLGSFLAAGLVDEVQCYVAPKLVGGHRSPGPIGGHGVNRLADALALEQLQVDTLGCDVRLRGSTPWEALPEEGRPDAP